MTRTPHSLLPIHCATCGEDWPEDRIGPCPNCPTGLPCRADTTDEVAPDPPCAGSRKRLENLPTCEVDVGHTDSWLATWRDEISGLTVCDRHRGQYDTSEHGPFSWARI